jgi:predicted HTH transcriptional regulator
MDEIDLTRLAIRENKQTEWTANVAGTGGVVRTLCAFANDLSNLGGGYVVCGAEEARDEHGFQTLVQTGLDADRLRELLDAQSYTAFDKTDPVIPNAVKYPKRALYEALGNALAHRDYESPDPARITVFRDRIELVSPGPLPPGADPGAFRAGTAGPKWRNQALAWFFNRLQLAQAEGQGIPAILRTMRDEGCPPPGFLTGPDSVVCMLPAHPRFGGHGKDALAK